MRISFLIAVSYTLLMLTACSSLEKDAKKAAELSTESLNYLSNGDLKNSEKTYKESQEIMKKYRNTDQFTEFLTIYNEAFENDAK